MCDNWVYMAAKVCCICYIMCTSACVCVRVWVCMCDIHGPIYYLWGSQSYPFLDNSDLLPNAVRMRQKVLPSTTPTHSPQPLSRISTFRVRSEGDSRSLNMGCCPLNPSGSCRAPHPQDATSNVCWQVSPSACPRHPSDWWVWVVWTGFVPPLQHNQEDKRRLTTKHRQSAERENEQASVQTEIERTTQISDLWTIGGHYHQANSRSTQT